jgi:hypothetical protein
MPTNTTGFRASGPEGFTHLYQISWIVAKSYRKEVGPFLLLSSAFLQGNRHGG